MAKYLKAALLIIGIASAGFAQSNTSEIKKLSLDADMIVTGQVVTKKSEWNKEKTRIYTRVTVKVDEYLKSQSPQKEVVVIHPGGEVGEVGELYSHTPSFSNNEDVLLFLRKDKTNDYRVLDGPEGKLTLYNDKSTGEKVTSSNKKISSLKSEIKSHLQGNR